MSLKPFGLDLVVAGVQIGVRSKFAGSSRAALNTQSQVPVDHGYIIISVDSVCIMTGCIES